MTCEAHGREHAADRRRRPPRERRAGHGGRRRGREDSKDARHRSLIVSASACISQRIRAAARPWPWPTAFSLTLTNPTAVHFNPPGPLAGP
jgi:hypothetical protein